LSAEPASGGCGGGGRQQDAKEKDMIRALGGFLFLGLAIMLPVQKTAAQDVLGGAIVGGALGGILGGALGAAAELLRVRPSAPPPARSSPPRPSAGRPATIGGGAVATIAIRTARGCKYSRVIVLTDRPGTAFAIAKRDPESDPEKRKPVFGKDHART
jgi:hypothetical protein